MNGLIVSREDTPGSADRRPIAIPLFDVDSTLLAGGNLVHRQAFLHALRTVYGIADPVPLPGSSHGMIDTQILAALLVHNGGSEAQARAGMDAALAAMADYYAAHRDEAEYIVLDGVVDLLQQLRAEGYPLGLLTGNEESIGWTKMEQSGLKQFFSFGAFGSMAHVRADLVPIARDRAEKALGRVVRLDQLFIVGDALRDVECARTAGVPVVAVATGVYAAEDLRQAGADLVLDSLVRRDAFLDFTRQRAILSAASRGAAG
jgi:phosphoglycolate phosphatase-like HAD superfamily hydrolase